MKKYNIIIECFSRKITSKKFFKNHVEIYKIFIYNYYILIRADGSRYEGNYVEGKKCGKGVYTWSMPYLFLFYINVKNIL